MKLLTSLPFSYMWIMHRVMGDVLTVLDLGCGDGEFTKSLCEGKKWKITGVELYDNSIKKAKSQNIYSKIVKANLVKLPQTLVKHDVVLASQVIEHLSKKDGERFLRQIEKYAKKRIVISTPVGFIPFHQIEKGAQDKNPLQKHLSGWSVDEMEKKGYKVYGQGLGILYKSALIRAFPGFMFPFFSMISFMFSPFVYFFPNKGMYLIAVKEL